jgi:formiminoglutamase
MEDLRIFFEPEHFIEKHLPGTYKPLTWGSRINCLTQKNFDWSNEEIIIVGCGEWRGADDTAPHTNSADAVREQLYAMYCWHGSIKVADAGNIIRGATIDDTRIALQTVLHEIQLAGKTAIVIGGSHDLTMQQYEAFKISEKKVIVAVADALLDLAESETLTADSFVMNMLTTTPNFVEHYNHIGFQSFYAHPLMIQTLDKLRFDFFRLGKVTEYIEDMEPVLRNSHILSIDMNVVRYSDAVANINGSPNGLDGEQICQITRYAGMSESLTSLGIFGFDATNDVHGMTAKLIAQMIWYFIDGFLIRKSESAFTDTDAFIIFHVTFTENDTVFLKSMRTNRWWMQLPDGSRIPCSYNDYVLASNNNIPERWLRAQERLV